ncbi:unnamed protein product [Citrullus colocynthis]|uniref:Uncharacterized protein n=1 Tax=Citrullus colocynthis TaxID=252529 RepID=A0ABP0YSC3_9ROSI
MSPSLGPAPLVYNKPSKENKQDSLLVAFKQAIKKKTLHIDLESIACLVSDAVTADTLTGEMAVINKFGDEHSNLLDRYERLSFEVRLNQAMLERSLSEPRTLRSQPRAQFTGPGSGSVQLPYLVTTTTTTTQQPRQGRRGSTFNFNNILNKLLKPILERKSRAKKELPHFKNPLSWKALSKSMRL